MQNALKRVGEMLANGGLLITGSNQEPGSVVHGGRYKKVGNAFVQLWDIWKWFADSLEHSGVVLNS